MCGLTFTDIDFFIYIFYQTLKNSMLQLVVSEMHRRVDDLTVTCRLTACTPGSAPGPTLDFEYGKAFTFSSLHTVVVYAN